MLGFLVGCDLRLAEVQEETLGFVTLEGRGKPAVHFVGFKVFNLKKLVLR